MSAPGSSYSNPVWHRGWRIYRSIFVDASSQFFFVHNEIRAAYTSDNRYGLAPSIDAAKADIDAREDGNG